MTDIQINLTQAIPSLRLIETAVPHLSKQFLEWKNRRRLRSVFGRLTAEHLKDMGLTLNDVDSVLLLPLSRDAECELRNIADGRSGNW
jgi:uncharacterized protein YjiS (DUF1127 family)